MNAQQSSLTRLHSYLSNFVPCCNASNAPEIADEFFGISDTLTAFLSLIKDELAVSGYATAIDLAKIYTDTQEYLVFWQAQAACQNVSAYAERYHGLHTPDDTELEELARELDREYRQAQFENELEEIMRTL